MKPQLPFLRTEFNYDREAASDETALLCPEPTRTQQQFLEEVDINTIMRKFGKTGEIPVGLRLPSYGDFTGVSDYHSAMNAVAQARESFDRLPAEIRAKFHNDPQEFLEFVEDQDNAEEAVKLGLAVKQAQDLATPPPAPPAGSSVPPPVPPPVAAPPAPPAQSST